MSGSVRLGSSGAAQPVAETVNAGRFVIQRHESLRPHDDFRLELGGVFKSWAIPKMFPRALGERRLAVQTDDHTLEFGDFEGQIPEGNPGAGSIRRFDEGTYRPRGSPDLAAQLDAGLARFCLRGAKVEGEFRLTLLRRGRWRNAAKRPEWLLEKRSSA